MEERLRSRFEAGLVADIQMPNTETRCAIVLKKAEQESIHIDHDIAMCLSEGISGSVRTLEGALTKLAAHASMDGSPITLELAQEIVEKDYINTLRRKPSFQQILDQVSNHYRIPSDDILGISRKQPIAFARHVTVYVTRRITGDSWKHIGELFGGRDHTSMMHGYKKIEGMLARDKEMHASVNMLIQDLYPDQR
jgi:chromosomal replication initiator protein